jgi:hypothetical protein
MSDEADTDARRRETEPLHARAEVELRVVSWRVARLVGAGYGQNDALALALDPRVDLHVAIGLLRDGCPVATALRILT